MWHCRADSVLSLANEIDRKIEDTLGVVTKTVLPESNCIFFASNLIAAVGGICQFLVLGIFDFLLL